MAQPKFLPLALRTGVPFGIAMSVFFALQKGNAVGGIVLGLTSGIAFGVALALFVMTQHKKFSAMRPEFEPEGLERDGAANHKAAGGWLFLTKKRLVFVPHRMNVGAGRIEIARDDIVAVKPSGKRKLELETTSGSLSFVVDPADQWPSVLAR